MKFTAKTITQLRISSTNMFIPQKTRSIKRLADEKVQEVRKKQKADKFAKNEIGSSSHKVEKGKTTPALEVFAHVVEPMVGVISYLSHFCFLFCPFLCFDCH